MLRSKPYSCQGCPLFDHGTDFSQVEGTGSLGIMFVAEASGEHEQRDQLPLRPYAPAGSVFERILRRLGMSRSVFSITNMCRCRPRNNWLDGAPYESSAVNHCKPNLLAALAQHHPHVIVALGGVAFAYLTGHGGPHEGVSYMRGYVFPALPEYSQAAGRDPLIVVPTFHPSFLRQGGIHMMGVLARDIRRALEIRRGTDTNYTLESLEVLAQEERDGYTGTEWFGANDADDGQIPF